MTPRRMLGMVTGLVLVLLAAGCGEGWGLHPGGDGKVELTYALWDAHEQVGYQKSIDEFERRHPNIHVTIEQIPYDSYQPKITAEYVSHDAPDLFWVNTPFLATWIRDGVLMDLTDRIAADHVDLSRYYPELVRLHSKDGHVYGLPKDWDTIAIYYNKDYFAAHHITVPEHLTWRTDGGGTFTRLLRQATVDTHGNSAASAGFDPHHVRTYAIGMANDPQSGYGSYLAMNGGSILPAPYARHVSLDRPAGTGALRYVTGLANDRHLAVPGDELGPNADGSYAQSLFAQGRIAMWQTGDWNTVPLSQAVKFHVGVLPLPAGPTGRTSVFNGLIDGISTQTEHPDEAWELEKWLGSARSQRIMGAGGYVWPAIRSLDPLFLKYWQRKGIDLTPFLDEARGQVVNFPVSPGIEEALPDMGQQLGPAFLNTEPLHTALDGAVRAANHDLDRAATE